MTALRIARRTLLGWVAALTAGAAVGTEAEAKPRKPPADDTFGELFGETF